MGGGEVLEVTHLITNRGRARILRDVSLAVRENEVVCLVGRNGAGKTTTMDSIMVLLLDEAFEGLAPAVVTRFAEAVARIKGLGISLLIAESNIMTASRVAERLYVMDRGEILFEGTPSDAFANQEVMRTIRG